MTDDAELRAALARHPVAVPDAEAVHAGIRRGVRRRRQRRRTATGIGVLAVVAVPVLGLRLLDGGDAQRPVQAASAPSVFVDPAQRARMTTICDEEVPSDASEAARETYDRSDYTPADALELQRVWASPCSLGAKVLAGEMLAAGEDLPIPPGEPSS